MEDLEISSLLNLLREYVFQLSSRLKYVTKIKRRTKDGQNATSVVNTNRFFAEDNLILLTCFKETSKAKREKKIRDF